MDMVMKAEAVMMTVASEAASMRAGVVINMAASEAARKRAGDDRVAHSLFLCWWRAIRENYLSKTEDVDKCTQSLAASFSCAVVLFCHFRYLKRVALCLMLA